MTATEIIFEVTEDEADGGYSASAIGFGIHTQGESLDELRRNVKEAVDCYFDESMSKRRLIRLRFVRNDSWRRSYGGKGINDLKEPAPNPETSVHRVTDYEVPWWSREELERDFRTGSGHTFLGGRAPHYGGPGATHRQASDGPQGQLRRRYT